MLKTNLNRIQKCMKGAEEGKELTIGFLGGSITQGSLASDETKTYAFQVFRWWEKTFPQAAFHYVNGGIGGTSSHFGAARAVQDLLMYQPDFVVVDFSVNDSTEQGEFFQETFEGLFRRILQWPSEPAVLVLNNVYYDTGGNMQKLHNIVADHYGIPHISIRDTVYQQILKGVYTREELTPDNLHPNDKGHALVAREICRFLEDARKETEKEAVQDIPREFPLPLTANAYEKASLLTIRNCSPKLFGFYTDTEEKAGHLDFYKNGWIGKKAGDKIVFETDASCIAVQYRKTIHKPALRAAVILDGDVSMEKILDGNFEETWGDCLYLEPILHHGEKKMHTVEIRILDDGQKEAAAFYLLALIAA